MKPWMNKTAQLFKPRTTYRYRYRSTAKESVPYYPANGVILDYYLANSPKENISLEVKDSYGKHIRTLTSEIPKADVKEDSESEMGDIEPEVKPKAELSKLAGTHRYVWDMRHEGPWDKKTSKNLKNGPIVAPGTYTFELKVDGKIYSQTGDILIDPKTEKAGIEQAEIEAQVELSLKIISLQTMAKKLANALDGKIKPLKVKLNKKESARTRSKLEAYESVYYQFVTPDGNYMRNMLISQLGYLNSMINRADQLPGKDAYNRFEELTKMLTKIQEDFDRL